MVAEGMANYFQGKWKPALAMLDDAEKLLRERCVGVTWERDNAILFGVLARYYLGEIAELIDRVPVRLREAHDIGDLYGATNLRTRGFIAWLAKDDAERAANELRIAREQWTQRALHIQHYFQLNAEAQIALYAGDPYRAYQRVCESWNPFKRAFFFRIVSIHTTMYDLRGRSALASIEGRPHERAELLASASRDARALTKFPDLGTRSTGVLLQANIAAASGDHAGALRLLEEAERGFLEADMALHRTVTRRRRGELLGGEAGADLITACDAWFSAQRVANPARLCAMLAPGFPGK
jgi:hypothetical protein